MCAILHLIAGQMPPKDMLFNAVYNNWHSYGLVTKVDGKLDIVKKVPESGEVDPEEVYKLLQDNIDHERFLHLRHNTAGATTLENTHPFEIYWNKKKNRHVVFMHNGTMYPYVSKKIINGITSDDLNGPSDTKNFVDQVLIPYLTAMDFGDGQGDITNPLTRQFVMKFWAGANRGLLIASDQDPMFIDDWKWVGPEGSKFRASNDQYFDKITRGPEFTRRLVRAENAKAAAAPTSKVSDNVFARLQDFKIESKHGFYTLSERLNAIYNDWEVWDRSNTVSLGYATADELKGLYADEQACLILMDWVFTDYAKLYKEYNELERKHDKSVKWNATFATKIKELEAELEQRVDAA